MPIHADSAHLEPVRRYPRLTRLDRGLRRWLLLGGLILLVLPAARGSHPWLGWLPYWLVIAPSLSLALLHRARLAAWYRAPRRPRRRRGGQARRAGAGQPTLARLARPSMQHG